MTPEAYDAEVRDFVARYRDERFDKHCTELVYQPMLELFDLPRAHDWRVYVCSGGGRDFMRAISEDTWGILQENVIGSAPEWSYRGGRLVRDNEMRGELALGPGKPSHLFAHTGRLPKFAAGNPMSITKAVTGKAMSTSRCSRSPTSHSRWCTTIRSASTKSQRAPNGSSRSPEL